MAIPELKSFKKRIKLRKARVDDSRNRPLSSIRYDYLSTEEKTQVLRKKDVEINGKDSQIFLLSRTNMRLKIRVRTYSERLKEYAIRGDMKSICHQLSRAFDLNLFKKKDVLLSTLKTVAQNFHVKGKQGNRYEDPVKKFYEGLMIIAGPKVLTYVANNLNGPEKDSVYRWRKKNSRNFNSGISEVNFESALIIIEGMMKEKEIANQVPWLCAEDETGVQKGVTFHQETDLLIGFCGKKVDDHKCLTDFQLVIGDTDESYEFMVKCFREYCIGTLARAMILNPLHAGLPRVVIGLFPTCNKFTHKDVEKQWIAIEEIFERKMSERIGPLVGHSSDGDSRRRKLMMQKMLKTDGVRYDPIGKKNGFLFTARKKVKGDGNWTISDVGDQDWIHNAKKFICHLDHISRCLQLGDGKFVLMNHVELLVEKMSVFKHGLTREHVRRERDRQNFKIAQQLAFKCVQESFDDLITGKVDGCPPDSTLLGTKVYLNVIHHYIEIFASPVLPLKSRISYAGLVVKFLSVWRNYIFWEEGLTLKNNFISNQCYLDIISSCHCAVIMICYFRDAYPNQPFPIIRMGSDCCEDFFSKNTQYIGNHPVYPFGTMLRNVKYMNRLMEIEAGSNGPQFSRSHSKQETVWEKQYNSEEKNDGILKVYPMVGEEVVLWKDGQKMADKFLRECGIVRERYEGYEWDGDEGLYEWFDSPFTSGDHPSLLSKLAKEELQVLENDDAEDHLTTYETNVTGSSGTTPTDDPVDFNLEATPEERTSVQNILEEAIDALEETPEGTPETASQKVSPTVNVEGHGRQYKSTIVKLLNEDTSLSKDRLTRVRYKAAQKDDNVPADDTSKSIVLFADYAVASEDGDHLDDLFDIVRIHRMTHLGKRRVEYKNPVKFEDQDTLKNLEIQCTYYKKMEPAEYVRDDRRGTINGSDILCHVNLDYDSGRNIFFLPGAEKDLLDGHCQRLRATTSISTIGTRERNKRSKPNHSEFDGTFTEIVQPVTDHSDTRKSTRKRTIKHVLC